MCLSERFDGIYLTQLTRHFSSAYILSNQFRIRIETDLDGSFSAVHSASRTSTVAQPVMSTSSFEVKVAIIFCSPDF